MSRRASYGPTGAPERVEYALEQLALAEIGEPWPTAAARKASGAAAVLAAIAAAGRSRGPLPASAGVVIRGPSGSRRRAR